MHSFRLMVLLFAAAAVSSAQERIGSDACGICHTEIAESFRLNLHARIDSDRPGARAGDWKGYACEACHGPGQKHAETTAVDDIVNPPRLSADKAARVCLTCHRNQRTGAGRLQSGHGRRQTPCFSCHPVHSATQPMVARTAGAVNGQCASCHQNVWAEFQRPYHHRVPEAAISCTDCHNPHGSFRQAAVRSFAAAEPSCFRCHPNTRGPFPFEHAPVRMEGCMSCHQPHGSANPRMLVRQEVQFVCLECHSNTLARAGTLGNTPPAFHDLRSARFRNCTICHQKVHGSYVDPNLLR